MTFRVITWNILAHAYINRGRYLKEAVEPTLRRRLLLERIAMLEADLVLLQEVEPDAFEAIVSQLGSGFVGQYAPKPGKPEGVALLARRSRVQLSHTERLLYRSQGRGGAHVAQLALVEVDGRKLVVGNTHLKWEPARTPRDRHVGYRQLMELLDQSERFGPGEAWIVGGDFNATSQSHPVTGALERGMQLSCRTQRPWDTCNINGKRRKLDYLLYTPATLRPQPGQLPALERDTPMPSMTWPSDHLAVEVEFSWVDA
ncbi:MAG: endonuclease/exonuclease/phosphatase family protein [Myxococcota bacterium]